METAVFAQQNPLTAIDIALEPDATMLQHAKDANVRLLKSFPKGFTLDETHHPHITMLQQFVRTDDLDKIFAAANEVLAKDNPSAWTLKAFKYYYIPSPPIGLAGIVVEPTEDLHRLQDELITAVTLHREDRDPCGALQRGRRTRHSTIPDRLRRKFCHNRCRQAF
jgi:2'-5' RNA ligase